MISFRDMSSTDLPRGENATKSMSAIWRSSRRISSPPRSPSRNAVAVFLSERSTIVSGTFVPSTATAFLIPYLRRLITSARPSTMMIASESMTFGPPGTLSSPIASIFSIRIASRTSSRRM